jgi:CheY-like chemotaxis protein
MAKIMLVEDDNNLREIYEARLSAEGYQIISAADGEAALALAIKEKPDLIISDIMMPKVSGFDMLDILRSTTETKNTKIIMMTALNQAEDKTKAEKLGADLYLVKSQVTLEDVVRSAKKMLGEQTPLNIGGISVEAPTPQPPNTNTTSLTANVNPVPEPSNTVANINQSVTNPANATNSGDNGTKQEEDLQNQIQQFISNNPTITTDASQTVASTNTTEQNTPTAPQAIAVTEPPAQASTPPTPAQNTQTQDASMQSPIAPVQATPQPQAIAVTEPPAQASTPPSSMAQPPSSMVNNTPADSNLSDDKPAGEQVIEKSAPANNADPGIDASLSGRKKVINPINDVTAGSPNLNALLEKEGDINSSSPTLNAVVTPEGSTLSGANGTPTINDVIAPNPQAVSEPAPQQPLPPPVA